MLRSDPVGPRGLRILRLIAMAPEEMDGVMTLVEPVQVQAAPSGQTITLPMLRPTQAGPLRLAAATGEGFTEQVLRQDEPPFEFQLVQFGMQLRITVRAFGEDSPHRDCLARLRLREGDDVGLSRGVLVEKGEGRCTLEPDEVRALQPERQELTVRLEPLVALSQLVALGEEAYVPILTRLLAHEQPEVRGSAVQVLVQLRGPAAIPLIRPLVEDEDEGVQAAARRVLSRFEAW